MKCVISLISGGILVGQVFFRDLHSINACA